MFKYRFILLNNYKNDYNQIFFYETKNKKIINNENILKIFIILLLIVISKFFYQYCTFFEEYKDSITKVDFHLNDVENIMGNYSLYNLYKYDQISLIIFEIDKWKVNDASILNFIVKYFTI